MKLRFLSLFSGIEAATVAFEPLGWECAAVAEIEPGPCQLLAHRYPNVPNLGDVTKITEAQIRALGHLDAVVFGSPCQDLSLAGKRKGFDGTRSSLFFTAIRIIRWARIHNGLRFALWENVFGAFSSNEGRDFAAVVGEMAGLADVQPPAHGWGSEGAAVGALGMLEWCVLDAQWFGVAQRRRRVFALADFGDWSNRPPILLEPHSLRGHSAPSRGQRQDAAAGTLRSIDGGSDVDHACAGHLQPVVSTLDAGYGRLQGCSGQDANHGHSHLVPIAFGGNNQSGPIEVATARNACGSGSGRLDFETETFLVQPAAIAFDCKASGQNGFGVGDIASTMRAMGHGASHANAGGQLAVVAFNAQQDPDFWIDRAGPLACTATQAQAVCVTGDVTHTLKAEGFDASEDGTGRGQPIVATAGALCAHTYSGGAGGRPEMAALGYFQPVGMEVRRLTPRECERLQGFPDDYTLVPLPERRKNSRGQMRMMADGPRYKALGNSWAVPVITLIGRRIEAALQTGKAA